MADTLARFATEDDEEWDEYITRQRRRPREPMTIDRVRIDNTAPVSDAIVRRALSLEPPETYEPKSLLEDLMQLHSLRYFGIIDYRIDGDEGDRELVITTPPRPSGRGSVQVGFGFSDDFNGNIGYTLSARHQFLAVNRRGGEWQNVLQLGTVGLFESQFYQPLDDAMRWFVEPSIRAPARAGGSLGRWKTGGPVRDRGCCGRIRRRSRARPLGRAPGHRVHRRGQGLPPDRRSVISIRQGTSRRFQPRFHGRHRRPGGLPTARSRGPRLLRAVFGDPRRGERHRSGGRPRGLLHQLRQQHAHAVPRVRRELREHPRLPQSLQARRSGTAFRARRQRAPRRETGAWRGCSTTTA